MRLWVSLLTGPRGTLPETRDVAEPYSIGRGSNADWMLPDPLNSLSRRHCILTPAVAAWRATDESLNGTFINDEARAIGEHSTCVLQDGDRLRLGSYVFAVHYSPPPGQPGPQPHDRLADDGTPGRDTGSGTSDGVPTGLEKRRLAARQRFPGAAGQLDLDVKCRRQPTARECLELATCNAGVAAARDSAAANPDNGTAPARGTEGRRASGVGGSARATGSSPRSAARRGGRGVPAWCRPDRFYARRSG